MQRTRENDALRLTTMTVASFRDDDDRITGLTRDGEMSLTVLPIQREGRLLDGQSLNLIPERELAEALNLNAAPVPASWKNHLRDCRMEAEGALAGYVQLEMTATGNGNWCAVNGKYRYSEDFGLEKNRDESA